MPTLRTEEAAAARAWGASTRQAYESLVCGGETARAIASARAAIREAGEFLSTITGDPRHGPLTLYSVADALATRPGMPDDPAAMDASLETVRLRTKLDRARKENAQLRRSLDNVMGEASAAQVAAASLERSGWRDLVADNVLTLVAICVMGALLLVRR